MKFTELNIPAEVMRGIEAVGFTDLTPVQEEAIPLALAGKDVAAQAQTGTGKTAAFLISLYSRMLADPKPTGEQPRALILAPTRELVAQICSDAEGLGTHCPFKVQAIFGGVDYDKQRQALRNGVDVIVATPGRLIDYYKQKVFSMRQVEMVVIDEADRMFDMGFIKDLRYILRQLPTFEKGYNPKGLGLFLWGYAKLYAVEKNQEYLQQIGHILGLLEQMKSIGYAGNCWGYNFDWQSRAFFVPKFTPTIVNSSFIGHALLDAYRFTGVEKALSMSLSIRDFIVKDLNREEHDGMLCFSYTPLDRYFVHNANLLGASLLVRLARYTADESLKDVALSGLRYSIHHQREDGSWYYAEKESSHWIDSFHTGFNLQSILYFFEEGLAGGYQEAFDRAVGFYTDHFFLADGTPKYYHDRIYPIDIHAPAQAVIILARLGDRYQRLAEKVANWMIVNMQDKEGYFYFQKKPNYTNKIPYMRWGQAWAPESGLRNHVVIAGGGRIGHYLARVLKDFGLAFVVIELDVRAVEEAKKAGLPVIYGDASQPTVLQAAAIEHASLLVITVPAMVVIQSIVLLVRQLGFTLDIVARAGGMEQIKDLRERGVTEVVQPELEAGLEMTRQALLHLGVPMAQIFRYADAVRRDAYVQLCEPDKACQNTALARSAGNLIELNWLVLQPESPVKNHSVVVRISTPTVPGQRSVRKR